VGVLAGSIVADRVSPKVLSWAAGAGFIAIGVWTIARG
jgi:putative Ca2+/H+ antiporter (TMEM165/GDT1 family)